MNVRKYCSAILALFAVGTICANAEWPSRKPRVVALSHAVEQFNRKASRHSLGRLQPPLTEEEVVAAIRLNDWREGMDPDVKAILEDIAKTRILPTGVILLGTEPSGRVTGGHEYSFWTITLFVRCWKLGLDKPSLKNKGEGVLIRRKWLSTHEHKDGQGEGDVRKAEPSVESPCIHNLRVIDSAKGQWAMAGKKPFDVVPQPDEISPYIRDGFLNVKCPGGGEYTIGPIGQPPTCSVRGHEIE